MKTTKVPKRECPLCRGTGRHRVSHVEFKRLESKGHKPAPCARCDGERIVAKAPPGPAAAGNVRCRFVYRDGRSIEAVLPQASLPESSAKMLYGTKNTVPAPFRFSAIVDDTFVYREIIELRRVSIAL